MLNGRHSPTLVALWATLFPVCLVLPDALQAASMSELVAKAKQEGALNAHVTTGITGRAQAKLAAAFKKHFGLDLDVTMATLAGRPLYGKAFAETKVGGVPTYDAIEGSGKNNVQLVAMGGVQKIDGWESLLAEINSDVHAGKAHPDQISPDPLSGYAFEYQFRLKALVYNPNLIAAKDLPKTHADLGESKYKDKWTQPPYAAHWDIGPLAFPDMPLEKWIDIVRKAGQTTAAVIPERAAMPRLAIGEFAFGLTNTYDFLRAKAKDASIPLKLVYFQDYNPVTGSFYVVRKGARHPAAATLFALWMTSPEAKAIWQPEIFATQYPWGDTELDREVRARIKETKAKIISFFDNQKSIDFLDWIGTPEGRKYRKAVSDAIAGRS